jgi:hypothetical protein
MARLLLIALLLACSAKPAHVPVANDPTDAGTADAPAAPAHVPRLPMLPGLAPVLLERGVQGIFGVTPDEQRLLVTHETMASCTCGFRGSGGNCTSANTVELSVLTVAGQSNSLGVKADQARFSPDGSFIVYSSWACIEHGVGVARGDGTGAHKITRNDNYSVAGNWIYFPDDNGTSLYRVPDADASPELVLAKLANYDLSPDGESIVNCTDHCELQSPVGAPPVSFPGKFAWWERGTNLILTLEPTSLVDRAGKVLWTGGTGVVAWTVSAAADGSSFAYVERTDTEVRVHVRQLASSAETVLPALQLPGWQDLGLGMVSLAPDGSRFGISLPMQGCSGNLCDEVRFAPSSGGSGWTSLTDHAWSSFSFSADSRNMFAENNDGLVASIAGGPPQLIGPPGVHLFMGPSPEPSGGLDKALFETRNRVGNMIHAVIGNADGSGGWNDLPDSVNCFDWAHRAAICWDFSVFPPSDSGTDLIIALDDGTLGTLATQVKGLVYAPAARKLFYANKTGDLYSVDNPGR